MTTEEKSRAEAHRRYDGDRLINEITGEYEPHDDYGYADTARQAFIAGALWAAPDHQAEAPSEEVAKAIRGLNYWAKNADNPAIRVDCAHARDLLATRPVVDDAAVDLTRDEIEWLLHAAQMVKHETEHPTAVATLRSALGGGS